MARSMTGRTRHCIRSMTHGGIMEMTVLTNETGGTVVTETLIEMGGVATMTATAKATVHLEKIEAAVGLAVHGPDHGHRAMEDPQLER